MRNKTILQKVISLFAIREKKIRPGIASSVRSPPAGPGRTPRGNSRVLAFLDIAPVNYGHALVIPKQHFETFLELPDDLWLEMGQVSRRLALALQKKLYARGFNLGMNNPPPGRWSRMLISM